jgi:hypothetical protein
VAFPLFEKSKKMNWTEKREIGFWRGATTGEPGLKNDETPIQAMVKKNNIMFYFCLFVCLFICLSNKNINVLEVEKV